MLLIGESTILLYGSEVSYSGELDSDNKAFGFGIARDASGCVLSGTWYNDKRHGICKLKFTEIYSMA